MKLKKVFTESMLANYGRTMRAVPREVIFNRSLIISVILYAMAAIPATWDQGSSSVVPSLPGFQHHFGISSGTNAKAIRNFVSIVYIGMGAGAACSFFINDRLGRRWSFRLYILVWIIGQMVAIFAPGLAGLYASRIVSGLGIGALTVTGPLSIVELAPAETRGLLTAWFSVAMGLSLFVSEFCVYGVFTHVSAGRLQYQIVWFSPCIFMLFCAIASFFVCESPRWLFLVNRPREAAQTLIRLRGLPADHPRVQLELREIEDSIRREKELFENSTGGDSGGSSSSSSSHHSHRSSVAGIVRETFTVPSNLRRVQQTIVSYGLAQLSGANSVTSYFIPILTLMGVGGDTTHHIFLSGMYAMAKLFFCLIASFFFIDALGRRKSLFVGISLQMVSDLYIGIYVKSKQEHSVTEAASQAAVAAIFIHAFGYAVGLLILPYVFGGELWPNRIRSFGGALSQCFHWLFIYGFSSGLPSLLAETDNWGAFIFFAAACFVSLVYVYLMVPEIAGLGVEEIDELFKGPWFNAYKRFKPTSSAAVSGVGAEIVGVSVVKQLSREESNIPLTTKN